MAVRVEHARVGVGREPGAHRDVGRPHRQRIERRRRQRPDAGVGLVAGVAVEAVQFGLAFAEIDIDAGFGKAIVARDRVAQLPPASTAILPASSSSVSALTR